MKKFNDSVQYIRDGKTIPAIVLKSQLTEDGELLTLLYADPNSGPGLLAQGTTRGIAQVASAVAPMTAGKMFGWFEGKTRPLTSEEAIKIADEVFGPAEPGDPSSPHAIDTQEAAPEEPADPTLSEPSEISSEQKPEESPSEDSPEEAK